MAICAFILFSNGTQYYDAVVPYSHRIGIRIAGAAAPRRDGPANARAVRTASSEQVRRPINRDGVDQWRPYAEWLGPLTDALGPVLAAYPAVPTGLI